MVQLTALILIVGSIFLAPVRAKTKIFCILCLTFFSAGVLLTPNRVSQKIAATLSDQGEDRQSEYPDDRLAFWHVHWEMIKEKPILGHGVDTDTSYRTPYYARLGLSEFKKKYEAHNTYLQIMTNGGIVALALFVLWLAWHIKATLELKDPWQRMAFLLCFTGFIIGSLTQNTFQDAEVRHALTGVLVGLWSLKSAKNSQNSQ
jgi:O-antigen ligase